MRTSTYTISLAMLLTAAAAKAQMVPIGAVGQG